VTLTNLDKRSWCV